MKLLEQMLEQYRNRHERLPNLIVLTPEALAALASKREIALRCAGVPVTCLESAPIDAVPDGDGLGVAVENGQLVSFDVRLPAHR